MHCKAVSNVVKARAQTKGSLLDTEAGNRLVGIGLATGGAQYVGQQPPRAGAASAGGDIAPATIESVQPPSPSCRICHSELHGDLPHEVEVLYHGEHRLVKDL